MEFHTGEPAKSWENTTPLGERAVRSGAFAEGTGYRLVFDATCSQPDFAKLFLSTGGSLNTAAAAGSTDFALTGSTASVHARLSCNKPSQLIVELPDTMINVNDGALHIDVGSKLSISSQRIGSAINGTLVDTHAGAGAVYLQTLLSPDCAHTQVPCVYGTLASHACTIGISSARIENYSGEEVDIVFTQQEARVSLMERAEQIVDTWAQSAWDLRQKIQFKLSPNLTKTVAKVPVGIAEKGYDLVHNIIDQDYPFSHASLNSLFEHAIAMELGYDDDYVKNMLDGTSKPGVKAAVWAQTVAAAASTISCYLVSYRADGRTVMGTDGSEFVATESWLRTPMRTPFEANDCDGTGLLVNAMLQTAVDSEPEVLKEHIYLNAVKNAIHPYYIHGVTVVGATAAEASGGGGSEEHVAGHALALMIPTIAFMTGLETAVKDSGASASGLREARYTAIFNPDVLATLPNEEAALISTGKLEGWSAIQQLQPFAIEGTTPASPILYIADPVRREEATQEAKRDDRAFAAAAPNVGRSLKSLHVGGHRKADPHRFYHSFIEFSVHPRHPLYADAALRDLGAAASQFVFVRPGTKLTEAGASPRQLAMGDFGVHPMYSVDTQTAMILDFASEASKADTLPPRAGPTVLTEAQSTAFKQSLNHLKRLDAKLSKADCSGHCVAYTLSLSTLVHNQRAVLHFADRISASSRAGEVVFHEVTDLAIHPDGKQAGMFVVVNVVV
jgi:hypothetical protein